jgi:hypothetical protein
MSTALLENSIASGEWNSSPYSFNIAPHPAALTTIGALPGMDSMTVLANSRADLSLPACR